MNDAQSTVTLNTPCIGFGQMRAPLCVYSLLGVAVMNEILVSEQARNARARRVAKAAGYEARKSRWRRDSLDNAGGFMIIDPETRFPVAGFNFDLDAQEVIEWCRAD